MFKSSKAVAWVVPVLVGVLVASTAVRAGMVTVDANSGASAKVSSSSCTSNSMTVSWTSNQGGGTWRFYYGTTDIAAPSTTGWDKTVTPTSKTVTITGLTPKTKYYALIAGWEGGASSRAQGYSHLNFTTDASAGIVVDRTSVPSLQAAQGYDAFGRRLGRIPANSVQFSNLGSEIQIKR